MKFYDFMISGSHAYYTFTHLKTFICLAWEVKNLKDLIEEDPPNVASEISHIFFTYSNFI